MQKNPGTFAPMCTLAMLGSDTNTFEVEDQLFIKGFYQGLSTDLGQQVPIKIEGIINWA